MGGPVHLAGDLDSWIHFPLHSNDIIAASFPQTQSRKNAHWDMSTPIERDHDSATDIRQRNQASLGGVHADAAIKLCMKTVTSSIRALQRSTIICALFKRGAESFQWSEKSASPCSTC
ncbi:hypothetical protein POX_a00098 [Penicillium oxalicum]|uniref:hypothetical protein n=1 Tax=Penicillium oxalicum TaxID=69781 RepID=UPI0020B6B4DE|nr:hypothetical protein POX_a00098 [Penicillium oxalicum]KAI2793518.1 hypothetical protein POX_a00098 [Penicillium oxalicum]